MLHHKEDGSGPVLVFLHGFCEDIRIWQNYLPFFYSRFRVIALDLPGFGQSAPEAPDLSVWAHSCLDTLNALGIDRFSLVGHSMGGYVALAIAELAPERVESLCLFHSTSRADTEEKKQARLKQVEFISEHGTKKYVQQLVPGLFKPGYAGNGLAFAMEIAESQSAEGLQSALLAMKDRPERTSVLSEAPFPVLLLSGQHDSLLPVADQAALAILPAICQFSLLQESGHMGMVEETEKARTEMMKFYSAFVRG